MDQTAPTRTKTFRAGVMSATLVLGAAAIGNVATFASLKTWYVYLNKPDFTPPNWVFGPAWSVLYILMGIAFWRILTLQNQVKGKTVAVIVFLIQLALNASWSIAFFGLRSPAGALIVIVLMLIAIVITIICCARLDRLAALCLAPYLAWVCFAAALNAAVWNLNP